MGRLRKSSGFSWGLIEPAREIQPDCRDWAKEWRNGSPVIVASREGKQEVISCPPIPQTPYDAFAVHGDGAPFPRVFADLADATRDIALVRRG